MNGTGFRYVSGLAAIAAALIAGACGGDTRTETTTSEVGGDVKQTWEPATVTEVKSVPVAALRASIKTRLDAAAPPPLGKDTWEHAQRLYARYAGGPLWLTADGLERERAGYLMR